MNKTAIHLRPTSLGRSNKEKGELKHLGLGDELTRALKDLGVGVFHLPTLEIKPKVFDKRKVKSQWLAFTSINSLRYIRDVELLTDKKIAVIGASTAKAFERIGITPDFVSPTADSVSFAESFVDSYKPDSPSVCLLKGSSAGNGFRNTLVEAGLQCEEVIVYEVVTCEISSRQEQELVSLLKHYTAGQNHLALCATSSFALRAFCTSSHVSKSLRSSLPVICIGPVTKQQAEKLGFQKIHVSKSADLLSVAECARVVLNS